MKINEIYLGDCLELMPKHVEDKSIDMIFCDLPYGTTKCKWDVIIPFDKLWSEYERVIKDNGVILLFAQSPFDKVLADRYPRGVQVFSSDTQKSKLHPTQKSLALIEYMIKTYTNEGDLILDNTCGSGTTLLGAAKLRRNYIGIEKEEKYYNITLDRLKDYR